MAVANELCRETPLPILIDLANIASVDRPARAVFSETSKPSRIALIGTSPLDRIMAGFMMGIHTPPNPVKFFAHEAAAVAWLKSGLDGG